MVVAWFWIGFAVTLLAAAAALTTGWRRRRRLHFVCAGATIVALGLTIYFARRLTEARVLPRAELDFHLIFAKAGGALLLPVIASGLWLAWTDGRSLTARRTHRVVLALWLTIVLIATGTGVWVYALSEPRLD
jgi:nitrate reductase gamma subunit